MGVTIVGELKMADNLTETLLQRRDRYVLKMPAKKKINSSVNKAEAGRVRERSFE